MQPTQATRWLSGAVALMAGAGAMSLALHASHPSADAELSTRPDPSPLEVSDASDPVVAADPAPAEAAPEPAPQEPAPEAAPGTPAQAIEQNWTYEAKGDDGAPNSYVGSQSSTGACGGDLPPCYVMERESRGDPTAVNSTGCGRRGCYGKWQADPQTSRALGYALPMDQYTEAIQDEFARRLWDDGQGCANWAAC